jgi:polysaccharide pyruvyl transferase WcaK-like protein
LFGVGWWQYQQKPDLISKQFYKKVLNKEIIHSVRDSYTEEKLNSIGINNTLNTSCPTLWALDGVNANHNNLKTKNCLFTLTDYSINVSTDTTLIESILSGFSGEIKFFPQGFEDIQYLNSLEVYKQNKVRIQILERNINEFYNHLSSDFCYIGTRLHAGIKCIEKGLESLIIAVDNRAKEMSKDVSLPVVDRLKIQTVNDWIEGKLIFKNISLPTESIIKWKNQFK